MTIETKGDVFEAVWDRLAGYQVFFNGWPRETLDGYKKRYDAALPDDLPVIPKAVGDYIRKTTAPGKNGLIEVFCSLADDIRAVGHDNIYKWDLWMLNNQAAVARAWVLGV
ncbi:hypothetical protein EFP44_09340, partial [Lacticaseibacillus paracasei]|nr:hypothetical protein [Lacticaseibacillus paracasei]